MIIKYTIEEEDFLTYQFFFLHENKKYNILNKSLKYIMGLIFVFQAINSFGAGNTTMGGVFIFFATLSFLYLDKFSKRRIKRLLLKTIRQNNANRFGTTEKLEFTPEFLNFNYISGESKIETQSILKIVEIKTHFFIKIAKNQAYVLPKRDLNNVDKIKSNWEQLNIELVNLGDLTFD